MINVSTIGFTQTSAEKFFDRLLTNGIKKVIDVRLNNTSQLSGFAKSSDLKYFLKSLGKIDYVHLPLLAPTESMLKTFKRDKGEWSVYQGHFLALMESRKIEHKIDPLFMKDACLLCSEATAHHCHRRLVCEYLNQKWDGKLQVKHL